MPAIGSPSIGSNSLATLYGQATNATFLGQIAMAAAAIAQLVLNESAGSYADDVARRKYAWQVQAAPVQYAPSIAFAVLSDFTTTSSSTDNALLARVLAIWSDLAQAYN